MRRIAIALGLLVLLSLDVHAGENEVTYTQDAPLVIKPETMPLAQPAVIPLCLERRTTIHSGAVSVDLLGGAHLHNETDQTIDLTGWILCSRWGGTQQGWILNGTLAPHATNAIDADLEPVELTTIAIHLYDRAGELVYGYYGVNSA